MLELRILGPLEARWDGQPVVLPGSTSRRVLAALAQSAPQWLSADRLAAEVWGERPPEGARKALQMHVSRLRRALAAASPDAERTLASGAAGYRLEILAEQLDAARFERLVADAGAAAEPRRARELALSALSLWRGAPMAGLSPDGALRTELARLEELRSVALEVRIDAELQLGRHVELIGELRQLVDEHPWRERLHAQAMLALYRAGRQADALEAFRHARAVLVEQLGIEPGPELRALHQAVLAHDPALDAPRPASAHRTGELPVPATEMVGRGRELESLVEALRREDVRLVTLTGPGGVGKSRLALETVRRLDAEFRDGGHFVDLAGTERSEDAAGAVAHALGVELSAGEGAGNGLRRVLAPTRMLVVLDNLEHLQDAMPEIVGALLSCRDVTVLATSREALRLRDEQRVPVPTLNLDSAVELFTAHARRHDPEFRGNRHSAAVISICRRLDGLPLAIELAAARMAVLSPPELEQRLGDAFSALPRAPRDAPDRHQTLRSTLDWSYRLLEPGDRRTLARLAVFSGGATIDAAEAVTGAGLDTLDSLVGKSLLARRGDRIALLETVRQYAVERLVEQDDEQATRRRHLEYFLALAAEAEPHLDRRTRRSRMAKVSAEAENLRSAFSWALEHDPGCAVALAGTLAPYWRLRTRPDEGRRWIRSALGAAGDAAARHDRARALLGDAVLAEREGDLAAARRSARQALPLFREFEDPRGIAGCLLALAGTYVALGRRAPALTLIEQARSLARSAGDEALVALSLRQQALATTPLGSAVEVGEGAVEQLLQVGNREDAADLLERLAQSAVQNGDYALSSRLFERSYSLKAAIRASGRRRS